MDSLKLQRNQLEPGINLLPTSYTCSPTMKKHQTAATDVVGISSTRVHMEHTCVTILDHTNVTVVERVSVTYVITRDSCLCTPESNHTNVTNVKTVSAC